tara:strand:- start:1879 stop:2016 length:138 start_codon:yes stop_codon:yes gene_type:complete
MFNAKLKNRLLRDIKKLPWKKISQGSFISFWRVIYEQGCDWMEST